MKRSPPSQRYARGWRHWSRLDTIDLVCAPDIMRPRPPEDLPPDRDEVHTMQAAVLEHCDTLGDRFAILDALPRQPGGGDATAAGAERHQRRPLLSLGAGAGRSCLSGRFVPPCGHVAGVYARSDQRVGVHKAPANEVLQGVLDLEVNLTDAQQGQLESLRASTACAPSPGVAFGSGGPEP